MVFEILAAFFFTLKHPGNMNYQLSRINYQKYAILRKTQKKYIFLFVYLHICKKSCNFAAD